MQLCTHNARTGSSPAVRRRLAPATPALLLSLALAAAWPLPSRAAIALLQPPKVVDGTRPLTLTLLVSADKANRTFLVPEAIDVVASADLQAPVRLHLERTAPGAATIRLRQGEHRIIEYSATIPPALRGTVRLDPVDIDAAPVLVTLNRAPRPDDPPAAQVAQATAAPAGSTAAAPTQGDRTATPAVPVVPVAASAEPAPVQTDLRDQGRLTFNDPMYFLVGAHDGANAKFQLSFKFRIFEGENPSSRSLLDNLYFGYTQFSLWDLAGDSHPFRDTNYRPSLFYYLSDTGVHNRTISRLSLAAGLEHESNGRDGDQSRSINTVFVKPTLYLGDLSSWHWSVSPKLYYYLEKNDNTDIASYRGYMDLKLAYGKPDSWEFAATMRKGTQKYYGSVDASVTYPLARLIPGTAGYLMAGYFVGYGESMLDYNHKLPWQFRLGYALSR
ncbi:phospholipase A [Cupriavidus sp. 2TAF22]|uniref:phospholipase A n=1 Tax=unclassified Cupriavidus TaxID=2640874 RepID=UPI003F901B73